MLRSYHPGRSGVEIPILHGSAVGWAEPCVIWMGPKPSFQNADVRSRGRLSFARTPMRSRQARLDAGMTAANEQVAAWECSDCGIDRDQLDRLHGGVNR